MAEPVLSVERLSKSFGALAATDDVSLDLRPGEIHALIGPNGAGKSTLIGLIAGSLRADSGRVAITGQDATGAGIAARARLGLVRTFQISALAMDATVLENTVLGAVGAQGRGFALWRPVLSNASLTAPARAALDRVGLGAQAARRVADLSHGERRRLEIAVALTLAPRLFVMDEPLAGLGPDGAQAMVALLDDLRQEAPILLVEHDMDAVFRLADRITVLVAGRVIASGKPDAIRADSHVRRAYLGESA